MKKAQVEKAMPIAITSARTDVSSVVTWSCCAQARATLEVGAVPPPCFCAAIQAARALLRLRVCKP
jgi:hypothetical protein